MFRSLLTLALSLILVAEASAQTAPAAAATKTAATKTTTAKAAKATARTSRRAAKKARRVALKSAPTAPRVNDGWPPLDDAQTAVATTASGDAASNNYGAPATASRGGEIDNANVYAAPGMPVHMRTSNGMVPYSVRPARKTATTTQTTLGN